jgi:tetratricopeptide (TPR) repeat protein
MRRFCPLVAAFLFSVAYCPGASHDPAPPANFKVAEAKAQSLDSEGDTKFSSGDYAGALAVYPEALSIYRQLSRTTGRDVLWDSRAGLVLEKMAKAHFRLNQVPAAVSNQKACADIATRISESADSESGRARAAEVLGTLSYYQLLNNQPREAQENAEQAARADPAQSWVKVNLAHAMLLSGRTDTARQLYLMERNTELGDQGTFEKVALRDVEEFEKRGIGGQAIEQVRQWYAVRSSSPGRPGSPGGGAIAPAPTPYVPLRVDLAAPSEREALESATLKWLKLMDDEQWRDTYERAAYSFRMAQPRYLWVRKCRAWRESLGRRLDRKPLGGEEIPSAETERQQYRLSYEVRFPNGSATETVQLEPSAPGVWEVTSYTLGAVRANR